MNQPTQIVWFKRDLRTTDHRPLLEASARGPVLPLFLIEDEVLQADDYAARHWQFTRASLIELSHKLSRLGQPLIVRRGEAVALLERLRVATDARAVWSHEETGNAITYARDLRVLRWAASVGIAFHEIPQTGVIRRLPHRDGWARKWEARMMEPVAPEPAALIPIPTIDPGPIPTAQELGLAFDDTALHQLGGEFHGHLLLESFLAGRGRGFSRAISSPLTAEAGGSRLSPYLAYGNLSIRQVLQATRAQMRALKTMQSESKDAGRASFLRGLHSFEGRLHWHCHFMQKLEDEPRIEHQNFVRAYDGLREEEFDVDRYQAYCEGRTGYPFVDACLRYLQATGWLNFRMRAMLMSFAAYHLWLDWRPVGLHLARLFTDYEPGIHWSQSQMQSGTTGINTVRIYSPTKQGHDQDPDGQFTRRWVPELAAVPLDFVFEPWRMTLDLQIKCGCRIGRDYPAPLVDHAVAVQHAKDRLFAIRGRRETRELADQVARKHGSRRSGIRQTGEVPKGRKKPAASGQMAMDLSGA